MLQNMYRKGDMMEKNRLIIIALVVVIVALLAGVAVMMSVTPKQNTVLTFEGEATITEGGSIRIHLTDENATAISNQTVNITFTDANRTASYYSVVTDENGTGELKLDKAAGDYNVTASYGGSDKYNPSNATEGLTVEAEVVQAPQPAQSSGNELYYDADINVYYNSDGVIVDPDGLHGQGVGTSYREARQHYESGDGME